MKLILKFLLLIILDFVALWLFVYYIDPDPSISIGLFIVVPFIFIINILIAIILLILKNKDYSIIFFINSIIASFIITFLFNKGIDRHQNNRLESWEFHHIDTSFTLTRWKETNTFYLSYSLNPGTSQGLLSGKCEFKDDEWILTYDSTKMKISNNFLIGLNNPFDTIRINKLIR